MIMYRQSIEQLGLHHQQELEARLNKNSIHHATIELSLNAVVTLMGSKFTAKANDDNIVVYFRNSIQSMTKTKTIGCKASHSKHLDHLTRKVSNKSDLNETRPFHQMRLLIGR